MFNPEASILCHGTPATTASEEEAAAVTVEKNVDAVVKSDVNKLDKAGVNEFLVKLRRPITQAKVIF